jgi:DNA-binding transcriptional LysR family regulator
MRHKRVLRYFDEVARTGSIRKAAEKLNVTASAINRRILDIEAEIGQPLFERMPRGMRLTAAGEAFLRYVRTDDSNLARVISEIADMSGLRRGLVRIAASQAVSYDLLPREIDKYRKAFPLVDFGVHICNRVAAMRQLVEHEADLALMFNPERSTNLQPIARVAQRLHAIMASDHPLAAHEVLRLHQIVAYPVALPENGLGSRMLLESFFSRSSLTYRVVLESNSFELLMRFVQQEPAVTFQIALGTPSGMSTDGIVSRPIHEPGLAAADVVLGQLRGRILPVAAAKFASQMALSLDALNA